ncbi:kinase-like domain-containing protein [Pterulicium gracile]|uniref:Kinase-like domain-containing protein n=1 Tax=Pterulicium gracile TaxID=1884261 RepID=A0A5C3Q230_9AGAR|nr:kinase-like domain-containing protein [Pterula gracilis]
MAFSWLNTLVSVVRCQVIDYLRKRGRNRYGTMKGKASRLTSGLVLKTGQHDAVSAELEALSFVAAHTSIPVPRVRYHWQDKGDASVIMQFMEGEMLQRVWADLSPAQRRHVMQTLSGFVDQLRLLSQPPPPSSLSHLPREGWIGSTLGHSFHDASMTQEVAAFGPFASERQFYNWRVSRFDLLTWNADTAAKLADIRQRMRDDHPIVLTHGDINRRNVLVCVHGPEQEDVEVTALLDWEQAGWRPIYWESRKWIFGNPKPREWADFALHGIGMGNNDDIQLDTELQAISGHIPP